MSQPNMLTNNIYILRILAKKIHVNVKGERRKLKDRTMIHLHTNQPSDIDDRTQRRKIEDHVHGQWVKEEKEKEEKNRNRKIEDHVH